MSLYSLQIDKETILKTKPLIVAPLSDTDIDTSILDIVSMADLIELRVDMFEKRGLSEIKNTFIDALNIFRKPIIGTVRDLSEGGLYKYEDRLSVYMTIAQLCVYIDIELSHEKLIQDFKRNHKNSGSRIIGSYHNFVETPNTDKLKELLDKGLSLGVDIVKIAVTPNTLEDVSRLLAFTDNNRDRQIISISMGDLGRQSRISAGLYGSLMTYGYVVKKTASGQISIPELRREIDSLYM